MTQPSYGQPQPNGYPQRGQQPSPGQQVAYGYLQQAPPVAQPQGYASQQQPLQVRQVGRSVTKPAWTVGDICWIIFTAGLAWPFIWLKRRSRTTVTRHY